ncbi:11470_t:CDS:1, partial [Diversispora eburnea]
MDINLQNLHPELKIEIFALIPNIKNISLTCKAWGSISRDPHALAKWIITKYGRAHALFHSIRIGKFLNIKVLHSLFANDIIISRYFIQRLLMHFGRYDPDLIKLKIEHNENIQDRDRLNELNKKICKSWASNLSIDVFVAIVTEGFSRFNDDVPVKGNDMELFHFLSAGPLVISQAEVKLKSNLPLIEELISKKLFIPFPPRPKLKFSDTIEYVSQAQALAREDYPAPDGHENNRQLNVIARAILIYPPLVKSWKDIGYIEICTDVNDLVLQGALLIFFPPSPPSNYCLPTVEVVINRLNELIDLGFQLSTTVMADAFHIFEIKLDKIGDILITAFHQVCNKSRSDIASLCLREIVKPVKNLKKMNVMQFLIKHIEKTNQMEVIKEILEHYNVGKDLLNRLIRSQGVLSLTLCGLFYKWILIEFGNNKDITIQCFEDIIISRIWIDIQLNKYPSHKYPPEMTKCAFTAICEIYKVFCQAQVPFKTNHLEIIHRAYTSEIITPFF